MPITLCLALALATMPSQQSTEDQEHRAAIERANAAVKAATPIASADPERPVYHFGPPAQWMNDPNGPIYYQGWYHMFYQHNPFGDRWDNMHWGHARSKDLVHWEHLPIALAPSKSKGEDHIYSGSTFLNANGLPTIFYTSIGKREPEQWAAMPDGPDLLTWHKYPANPVVSQATNGRTPIAEWRDPFVFKMDGQTYMVTGGGLNGHGIVALYKTANPELTAWQYVGPLFNHPDSDIGNIECPNIVKIGNRWVLLISVRGRVESYVGTIDKETMRFTTDRRGVLNEGSYASQLAPDGKGRIVQFAWVNTENNHGWNGWLTIPSVLTLAKDGTLLRNPIPEFSQLRAASITLKDQDLEGTLELTKQISGDTLEIIADIDPGQATNIAIKLRASNDGARTFTINYEPNNRLLRLPGRTPVQMQPEPTLKLHIFLDKKAVDLYAGQGAITQSTQVQNPQQGDNGIQITATGHKAKIKSLTIYKLNPAHK